MSALSGLNQSQITALNDRWNNEFFPSMQSSNPSLSMQMDTPYAFGEMVGKIHQILCEGKKVCLFVGRVSSEDLPPSNGAEEWVSADMHRVNGQEKSVAGRIHLWIDCNEQGTIECLEKLFDRIVVDCSTIKFLDDDFAKRFSVMFHSPESTLVFESSTGEQWMNNQVKEKTFSTQSYKVLYPIRDAINDNKKRQKYMENYYASVPADQQEKDWNEFMETPKAKELAEFGLGRENLKSNFVRYITERDGIQSISEQYQKWGLEQLKLHLETLFEHVELHSKEPFPYPNNWNRKGYFLVSHPKL